MRKKWLAVVAALVALLAVGVAAAAPPAARQPVSFSLIGRYDTGQGAAAAEIVAFDDDRMYLISTSQNSLDIVAVGNPATPALQRRIDLTPYGAAVNSVAADHGVVAVALEANPKTNPGSVAFFDNDGQFLSQVQAGALPDMVAFTPNGRYLLVANEGEPSSYGAAGSVDPVGSVSIVDMHHGAARLTQSDVVTAGFEQFNAGGPLHQQLDPRVRVFGLNASVAQDLEPEYITVSQDSHTAWVTLQENNAIATLDLKSQQFTRIVSLGFKDHSRPGNALDPSDRDGPGGTGAIAIAQWPVFGMYQPDAIASYRAKGDTYLVTANEGDARDYSGFAEERRVSLLNLDSAAFPNAAALKNNAALGRLNVTSTLGDTDHDGDYDQLYAFGARSFSIWTGAGKLVFDSGDQIERAIASLSPALFNSEGTPGGFDTRSDNKGPEPEGVAVGEIGNRIYAFIGLERTGGLMIYDISDPAAPAFLQYAANPTPGADRGPEGITFIPANRSPIKRALVLVGNEVSGTVAIFAANQ